VEATGSRLVRPQGKTPGRVRRCLRRVSRALAAIRPRDLAVILGTSIAAVTVATATSRVVLGHNATDGAMVYLLGVVVVAVRFGYVPSLATAALSVAAFDFFFTAPYLSFAVDDRRYLLTFAVMLVVAVVTSNLTERMRRHATRAAELALERGRLARDAQQVRAEVETERLRNALLSSVSHDLRTPLSVVQGTATALLDGGDALSSLRKKEYLQTISNEASRMNRLVQNLLDMTALQAGALRVRKTWHPIEELIGVALGGLEQAIGARSVVVCIAEDASWVAADETLLQQVLVNLVENATRYTPADASIRIATQRVQSGVEIAVSDSGPGVPVGEEEAVFEKFHRGTRTGGGMGLGLTICRGIVTAHGGRIWCENRAEGGASFRFVIPFDGEPPRTWTVPEEAISRYPER
jgi:two-component system sensor histidine kinase KdpD